MKPFLKWAGGKRWLTSNYEGIFPTNFNRYIEPFLGSGAVFFHMTPKKAILSDTNKDLVDTYKGIKTNWKSIYNLLEIHHKNHSYEYYYQIRNSNFDLIEERSAQFIYLNRTCWNGLYRVNKKGNFNVPKGSKTSVLFDDDNFEAIAKQLKNAQLKNWDFEKTINKAEEGDLLFVDPPYTVRHNYNGFIKYNEKLFTWDDQERLFYSLNKAKGRGVKIICTNAYHESIKLLYEDNFKITELTRNSSISSKSSTRGNFEELLITN